MKGFLALYFLIAVLRTFEAVPMMGPVGHIILRSIHDCEEQPAGGDVVLHTELKTIDGKGTKALFGTASMKIAIDSSIDYTLEVQRKEGGSWKKFYKNKGKFCVDMPKHLDKIWGKATKAAKPPLPKLCPLKPGNYTLENFQVSSRDIELPSVFYGSLLATFTMSKNGKMLMCLKGEGDSQAPSF